MDFMSSVNESDTEPMYTEMLEDIREGSQSFPIINRRGVSYKIRDLIKQGQAEWKRALFSTQNMGKGLHKIFKGVVNDILKSFTNSG